MRGPLVPNPKVQMEDRIQVGVRVRHKGQQYADALRYGTATVAEVSGEHYADASYDIRVDVDEPGSGYSGPWWNSDHVEVIR